MIDSRLGRLRLLEIFLQMTDFHGEQVYKWEPSYLWIEIHAHTSIQPFPYLTKPKFKKKEKKTTMKAHTLMYRKWNKTKNTQVLAPLLINELR